MSPTPELPSEQQNDGLQSFLSALTKLQSHIEGNQPVTAADLEELKTNVASVAVHSDKTQATNESISLKEHQRNLLIIEQIKTGDFSQLPALTELPVEFVNSILASINGHISELDLSGVKQLTPEAAAIIATGNRPSNILLTGLQSLDAKTAKQLGGFVHGSLTITVPPLDLTQETVDALQENRALRITVDRSALASITKLTPGQARCLAFFTDRRCELPALKTITPEILRTLAHANVSVVFTDLTTLDEPCAEVLSAAPHACMNFQTFDAPDRILSILNESPGCLKTDSMDLSMTELSPTRAYFIANALREQNAVFPNVQELDWRAAGALKKWSVESLSFPALKNIDRLSAEKLAYVDTKVMSFDGLENPSPDVLEMLVDMHPNVIYGYDCPHRLSLLGMKSITPQQAKVIASKFRGNELVLGITDLPPAAARYFAKLDTRILQMNGLTSLSGEAARSLASNRYLRYIRLNGLKSIRTPDTTYLGMKSVAARFFPEYMKKGQDALLSGTSAFVELNGVESITSEDAELLASLPALEQSRSIRTYSRRGRSIRSSGSRTKYTPKEIFLQSAADVSPDVAEILARCKAHISYSQANAAAVEEARKKQNISTESNL